MTEIYPECKTCANFNVDDRPCKWCIGGDFYQKKVITNADKIRKLSDEELANFIEDAVCPPELIWKPPYECEKDMCPKCWLAWLQAEVEE